ncbi:hypothetical protein GCM10009792_04870 [Microcella alkalica]|uniref:Putative membrane protein n=1 Tax=Microcella alkalica TaxID=355930 RepID=A0A839EAQ7_9MICO|nr:hypothetical protein [Microcella alkalica]MBA8848810.1 putative membrane protein [Microcella alkalica]
MEFLYSFLLVGHFIGLAAIVGPFLLQMRRNKNFAITAVLAGAVTQLVTGVAMTGLAEPLDHDLDYAKIITKLVIALVVFVAALLGWRRARSGSNDRSIKPFFHAAGGLALVNVVLAVFW